MKPTRRSSKFRKLTLEDSDDEYGHDAIADLELDDGKCLVRKMIFSS